MSRPRSLSPADRRTLNPSSSSSANLNPNRSVLLTPKSSVASLRSNRLSSSENINHIHSHSSSESMGRPHRLSAHYREEDIDFDVESIQHFRRSSMNSYQATPHNSMGRSEGRRLLGNYDADGVDYERRGEGEEDDDEDGEGDDNGALEEQRQAQQAGVAKIEALYRTFGNNRMAVWTLYGAIAGVVFAFTLDMSTTSLFLPFALASFKRHSLIAAVSVAESIITAVFKPFIAKICDISSRQHAYSFVLSLYVIGYLLITFSATIFQFSAGRVIATVGEAGLALVSDIIVADLSPLEWRGFMHALTAAPNLVFSFVGANIAGKLIDKDAWRLGYGMFVIIIPMLVLPAIVILFKADKLAAKKGETSFAASPYERRMREMAGRSGIKKVGWFDLIRRYAVEMDLIGLILLGTSFSLIFLPFSLAPNAKDGWENGDMLGMLIMGPLLFLFFIFYEIKFAPCKLMPTRILKNKTFILACVIDIFYFASGNMRAIYYSSYTFVITEWTSTEWGRFQNLSTIVLSSCGICAGLWLRYTHRYKMLQLSGLFLRLGGMALTLYARGDKATTFNLIATQVCIYAGGSLSVVGSRVASQASVPHADLAVTISLLALFTKLGGAIGSAVAGATWSSSMRRNMRLELPESVSPEQIEKLYQDIKAAKNGDPIIRQGVIRAYDRTIEPLFWAALLLSLIPIVAGILMPNYHLGKSHNVVEQVDAAGRKTVAAGESLDPTVDPEEFKKAKRESSIRGSLFAPRDNFQGYGSTSDSSSTSTIAYIRNDEEAVADEEQGSVKNLRT